MRIIKISLVLLVGLVTSISMSAQLPVSLGVKAGMNLSEIQEVGDNIKVGLNIGVTAELTLPSSFYLMSGLELTTKGNKVKDVIVPTSSGGTMPVTTATFNAMYLQLPIHAGYKLDLTPGTKLVFRAGPYLAYGIGGKISYKAKDIENTDFFSDETNRFDFGIGGSVGVEFLDKINVSLGADQGLSKVIKNTKTKNRCAYISVGYKF